jgi:hypothetical protein
MSYNCDGGVIMASSKTRLPKQTRLNAAQRIDDYAEYVHASWTLDDFEELALLKGGEETAELNGFLGSLYTQPPHWH